MRFSSALIRRLLRSGPAMTRSIDFFELGLADDFLVAASGQDCSFVDQVFQIGADKAGCRAGQSDEISVRRQRFALSVDAAKSFHDRAYPDDRARRGGQNDRGEAGRDRGCQDGW